MRHTARAFAAHRFHLVVLLLVSALVGACSTPHGGLFTDRSATPGPALISGEYLATIKAPLIGSVSGRITATPIKGGFMALTRPSIAWSMVGGIEGLFGPLFVKSLFPQGVIITWVSSLPESGKPGEGYIGPGESPRLQVRTRITSPNGPAEIFAPDGRRLATLTLRRLGPAESEPAPDYRAIAAGVERAVRDNLYDADLARSGGVRAYLRHLKSNAALARDDIEFIFGTVVAARSRLSCALPLVFPALDGDWQSQLVDLSTMTVEFNAKTGIATLKADAFLTAADVDRTFEQIAAVNAKGLLIDLTNCPGVTLASLRAAAWVVDAPIDAGAFFGAAARRAHRQGTLGMLPNLTLDSAESVERIERQLDQSGAAGITIHPVEKPFRGPVAVLTSNRTTTSAEPLAWALKAAASDRLQVFGIATAGRPTLSRPVEVGSGWVAWIPSLDYQPPAPYAADPTTKGCRPKSPAPSVHQGRKDALAWLDRESGDVAVSAAP